jgi:hypothetical protein
MEDSICLCDLGRIALRQPAAGSHLKSDKKKADVVEHLKAFDHVGLLANEPPGTAGLLFI